MTISEKVANLKGFIEGIELDDKKPENKVLLKIADIILPLLSNLHLRC